MWDIKAIFNLIALVIQSGVYNFYVWELSHPVFNIALVRALYYGVTAAFLFYLTVDDMIGRVSDRHFEISVICKISLIINFMFFALTLCSILKNPVLYLLLFNGCIIAVSSMVLISGIRHDFFRD